MTIGLRNISHNEQGKINIWIVIVVVAFVLLARYGFYLEGKYGTQSKPVTKLSEEEIKLYANAYCKNRSEIIWLRYPLINEVDGKLELNENNAKAGKDLTQKDCLKTIQYLSENNMTKGIDEIVEQKYQIGTESWSIPFIVGLPNKINTTVTKNSKQEQWVYTNDGSNYMFIYVRDGKINSFQNF